jgi:HlyD family secretion protein
MGIWIKRLGLLGLALAIAGGFYFAMREQPVAVDTAIVISGPMKVTIDEEGVTRVKDVYAVSSPIAGHLDRTTLKEGEVVKANETIIASIHPLDPPFLDQRTRAELTAAAQAARSAVALAKVEEQRAQTALELAQSNYQRAAKLAETKTISISQLEQIHSQMQLDKAQVDSARAAIGLRQAELASAKARLQQPGDQATDTANEVCCVKITAPIDGVVLKILTRSEQAVLPGTSIAEIGDPKNLEIIVDLLSSDAARIRPGAKVTITDWGGEEDLEGFVRMVEPAAFTKVSSLGIEEQRVNVVVDPTMVPQSLGHGYRILARLGIWENPNARQVPIGALFRSQGRWSAFVVADGRVTLQQIEIGRMNSVNAEIVDGLDEGATVVLYPNDLLEDGSLVEQRSSL